MKWFRKAAEHGDADAQNSLGYSYQTGIGIAQDATEAVRWFTLAAEHRFPRAWANLAICHANGYGVPKDVVESYAWWNLASTEMERAARSRDDLERLMSPAQVSAAQRRAKMSPVTSKGTTQGRNSAIKITHPSQHGD
ncbi:MAG: tetratricopeptide repeat protein [Verrucomicrobia bacterium]|nr:tetratricopeptide repeat protein [Verrucomicrobiota bacterium]